MFDSIQDFILVYDDLKKFLIENNQFSLENNFGHHMRKVMLLSCASYFETEIQELIKTFVEQQSSDDRVLSFVQNKAITRQYHTYFNWDGKMSIHSWQCLEVILKIRHRKKLLIMKN